MASSKLMPSSTSTSSRNSDLRRNPVSKPDHLVPDFRNFQKLNSENTTSSRNNGGDLDTPSNSMTTLDGFLRNVYGEADESQSSASAGVAAAGNTLLNAEITLLDAAGAIAPITDAQVGPEPAPVRKKTVDDVWREIVEGKKIEQQRVECKEEAIDEMMTLEDFLVKAGAVEEAAVMASVEEDVKLEAGAVGSTGGVFAFESPYMTRQGSVESGGLMGYGNGGGDEVMGRTGVGRGKRRAANLLEPMDKAAQQRQRRMIKNRESAARSRERKQAYQVELESMAVRLEEENEQLLKEKAEWTKERRKLLMEKIIPVVEEQRPARILRRVRSASW